MPNYTEPDTIDYCASAHLERVRPVLDKITDKWTILILTALGSEPRRFNQLKRQLDGITHKALSDALKRLQRNGLVTRTVLPTGPVGVEYAITPLGLSLREPFQAICAWALTHKDEIDDAADAYEQMNL